MNKKNYISIVIALCILGTFNIFTIQTVTLDQSVTTKVLDRATGNLYLGLSEAMDDTALAIIRFARYHGYGTPSFQTVVPSSDDLINGDTIEYLALANSRGNKDSLIAAVTQDINGINLQTTVLAYSDNFTKDQKKGQSKELDDADTSTTEGIVGLTGGIVRLETTNTYLFAAVKPSASDNDPAIFGDPDSGIAIIQATDDNDEILLTQKTTERVDETTEQLGIFDQPKITTNENEKQVSLYWDDKLQRLYIGISSIRTDTTNTVTSGARSIIVAQVNEEGTATFANIAPDTAFTPRAANEIVGAIQETDQNSLTIGALFIRVMHTSTGKSYLIINGGNAIKDNGSTTIPGNTIFALPLVNSNDPTNITQGTLANWQLTSPTTPFETAATTPSEIYSSNNPQTNVGNAPFRLLPENRISDIVVVGDSVYVSTQEDADNQNESGIWYSQALFDELGRIYRWTPWTKRAFPQAIAKIEGEQKTEISGITFFDVDASNGKIWAIPTEDNTQVYSTAWIRAGDSSTENDLREILNKDFAYGCFSILDLDQSTKNLAQRSPARYTLFGGVNQVAFAKISASVQNNTPYNKNIETNIQYTQDVNAGTFNDPENYLLTALPTNAGCVKVLEYSRTYSTNYFFAGTQNGLYIFADRTGDAFTVDETVSNLDEEPFFSRRWQEVPNIPGAIIDIKSDGEFLYVLTFETSKVKPIKNCLYKVPFTSNFKENNVNGMFNPNTIRKIAESAVQEINSDLSAAKIFFAIEIMTTYSNNKFINEIVLATNNGIYRSNEVSEAKNQANAQWKPVDEDDTSMYTGIFAIDNRPTNTFTTDNIITDTAYILSTVWPVQVADENSCLTFEKSNIRQLNGSDNAALPMFIPVHFNAISAGDIEIDKEFETLNPISSFWSDGARRFFIMQRMCDPKWANKIFVIPYDIKEWCVESQDTMMLTDPALQQIKTFYWIRHIGASGILMAGTNTGVVTLE